MIKIYLCKISWSTYNSRWC